MVTSQLPQTQFSTYNKLVLADIYRPSFQNRQIHFYHCHQNLPEREARRSQKAWDHPVTSTAWNRPMSMSQQPNAPVSLRGAADFRTTCTLTNMLITQEDRERLVVHDESKEKKNRLHQTSHPAIRITFHFPL